MSIYSFCHPVKLISSVSDLSSARRSKFIYIVSFTKSLCRFSKICYWPITNLAKAAQRFGKGDYINEFRPSGAREIRNAAYEFDRMAKRINRHLNQRSEMLSGISHDLRTPLTRLKLQLAMVNDKNISSNMSKDIDEMENMLNDYLQFAKTQA